MLSMIVACANGNVIGKDNKLLWHLPEDLKRFKEITSGKTIIMGRKTFDSLGRVLPNRKHIVLTRDTSWKYDDENVEVINDVSKLDKYINSEEENFVIGGAMIYNLLLKNTQKIYLTRIHKDFVGDAFFPKIKEEEWEKIDTKKGIRNEENPYDYEYITYIRK